MVYSEQEFIVNLEPEMQKIFYNAKKNLSDSLPRDFINYSPYSLFFLSKRYVDCICGMPADVSQQIFLNYLNEDSDKYNPDMAARACEFYGGIMYKRLESPRNILSISDFEFRLNMVYNILAGKNSAFVGLGDLSGHILEGFRNTTNDIRGSNIVHFDFNRDR